MDITRAVCDCCPGGSIMMTSEVFFKAMHLAPQNGRNRHFRMFPGNGSGDGGYLQGSATSPTQGEIRVKKTSPRKTIVDGVGVGASLGLPLTGGKSLTFMDHLSPFSMHSNSVSQKAAASGGGRHQTVELVLSHQRSQQLDIPSSLGGSEGNVMYAGDYKMMKLEGSSGASVMQQSLFISVPTELTARLPHLAPVRYVEVSEEHTRLLFFKQ
jgi:hypothetical protein